MTIGRSKLQLAVGSWFFPYLQPRCTDGPLPRSTGGRHDFIQAGNCRVSWDLLASVWWMRQRSAGCGVSTTRDWISRRRSRLWTHRTDNGVCDRAHFWLPFESGSFYRTRGRKAVPSQGIVTLHSRSGARRICSGWGLVPDRDWEAGIRSKRWFRIKWLRGTLTRWLYLVLMLCRGSCAHLFFPDDHHGSNGSAGASRLCAYRNRPWIDTDSLDRNSDNEPLSESSAQYWTGNLCWRMGDCRTLVVLGGADHWRHPGRNVVRSDIRVKR